MLLRKSNSKIASKTWARRWSRKLLPRHLTLLGDGTTTATVLAQGIYREGVKLLAAGTNAMDLKRGIDHAVGTIVQSLAKLL